MSGSSSSEGDSGWSMAAKLTISSPLHHEGDTKVTTPSALPPLRDQSQGQLPHESPGTPGEVDLDSQNNDSGNLEGIRGPGELDGYGGGAWNGVANVLGLRSGSSPPMPKFYQRDVMKLIKENNRLQEELYKTQRTLEKYSHELQKSTADAHAYYRRGKELHQENVKLKDQVQDLEKKYNVLKDLPVGKVEGRLKIVERFLDDEVPKLLAHLDALEEATHAAVAFLVDNIVFRASEAFSNELEESKDMIRLQVGVPLLKHLFAQAEKAASVSDPTRGSRVLVRISSMTLINSFLYSTEPSSLTTLHLLKAMSHLFRIASWALPGAKSRASFETALHPIIASFKQAKSSKEKMSRSGRFVNNAIVFAWPQIGGKFVPSAMEAASADGQPLVTNPSGEVVAKLSFGVEKGGKAIILPTIVLNVALDLALKKEDDAFLARQTSNMALQPDCDGRE